MKTPTLIRVAALIAAAAVSLVLAQSLAMLGLPRDAAPQLAQAAAAVLWPR